MRKNIWGANLSLNEFLELQYIIVVREKEKIMEKLIKCYI